MHCYSQISDLFDSNDSFQRQWKLKCAVVQNMSSIKSLHKYRKKQAKAHPLAATTLEMTDKVNELVDRYRLLVNGYIAELKTQYDRKSNCNSTGTAPIDSSSGYAAVSAPEAYSSSSGRNSSSVDVVINTTGAVGLNASNSNGYNKSIASNAYDNDIYDDEFGNQRQYYPYELGGYDSDDMNWGSMGGNPTYMAIFDSKNFPAQEEDYGGVAHYNGINEARASLIDGNISSSSGRPMATYPAYTHGTLQYDPTSGSCSSASFPAPIANSFPYSTIAFQQPSIVAVRPPMPPPRPPITPPPSALCTTTASASTLSYSRKMFKKTAISTYNPSGFITAPVSETSAEPVIGASAGDLRVDASAAVPDSMEEPLGYVIDTIGQAPLPYHGDAYASMELQASSLSAPLASTSLPVTTALSPPLDDITLSNLPAPTQPDTRKPAKLSKQAKLELYNASLDLYADEFEVNEQECREAYLFCVNRKKVVSLLYLYINYTNLIYTYIYVYICVM